MHLNSGLLTRSHYASRRPCDRPDWWGLSVYILSPRANSEFVPKFHISHSLIWSASTDIKSLPHYNTPKTVALSKFRNNAAFAIHSSKFGPNTADVRRVLKAVQFSYHLAFFISQRLTLPPSFIYEHTEWLLPGSHQNRKIICSYVLNVAIPTLASQLSFISLCLRLVPYGRFTHMFKEILIRSPKLSLLLNASHAVVLGEIKQNGLPRSVVTKMCSADLRRGSLDTFI